MISDSQTLLSATNSCDSMDVIPKMAKYKRAELMEEEDSVHLDHHNNISAVKAVPHQPPGLWKARTVLEKILIFLILTLAVAFTIAVIVAVQERELVIRFETNPSFTGGGGGGSKNTCTSRACIKIASDILISMNTTANPCHDFYEYACGGWVQDNPIPEGKSSWGTFQKLGQQNQMVMRRVLESPTYAKSDSEKKAQKFYKSCLDNDARQESLGAKPLQDLVVKVGGWSVTESKFDLIKWNFQEQLQILHNDYNMEGFFAWEVAEDNKNSSRYVIQIYQAGLTLPRDYYLNETHSKIMDAYLTYMTRVCMLLGAKDENRTQEKMRQVLDFETEIAKFTIPSDEMRDDEKMYNPMNLTQLADLMPAINWKSYFTSAFKSTNHTITDSEEVVLISTDYLANLSQLILNHTKSDQGKAVLNNYMVWHLVKTMACCLNKDFREAEKIWRKAIFGTDGTEETWRTCVGETNNNLGFALGAMFIRESFQRDSRTIAQDMIEHIRTAFQENLENLSWADEETKELAREKAAATTDMIGYPDFILSSKELDKSYKDLEIQETDYFGNVLKVMKYILKKNVAKIDEPVNKTRWGMTPPTVNAYYTPTSNQMVIPAGILQQPFFDPDYPKSINYGAIGVVIGHELTHGFDDQGREYDKDGNMHQWWQSETVSKFKEQTECLVNQYSKLKIDGEAVNGKQTLGENIADNGGLKAAYRAFKSLARQDPLLPGLNFSSDQLFFISFAQVWCSATLKESLVLQMQSDTHVPSPLRVAGTLVNMQEFANTFRCPIGTPMNPQSKCVVW